MSGITLAKDITKVVFDIAFATLEAIEKDGYQHTDFFAALSSEDFRKDLALLIENLVKKNPAPTPPAV
jgi:hypothetical protein